MEVIIWLTDRACRAIDTFLAVGESWCRNALERGLIKRKNTWSLIKAVPRITDSTSWPIDTSLAVGKGARDTFIKGWNYVNNNAEKDLECSQLNKMNKKVHKKHQLSKNCNKGLCCMRNILSWRKLKVNKDKLAIRLTIEPNAHVEQTGPSEQAWQLGMELHRKQVRPAELFSESTCGSVESVASGARSTDGATGT